MERTMCSECDDLRLKIAHNRGLSIGLTDPASVSLNKADLATLEKQLDVVLAVHLEEARPSSQKAIVKDRWSIAPLISDTPA